eukprot:14167824-Alexandrium_andersonii.AAC.1
MAGVPMPSGAQPMKHGGLRGAMADLEAAQAAAWRVANQPTSAPPAMPLQFSSALPAASSDAP